MDCDVCRDKLPDFLLDELPEPEAVLVQEHLALCPPCQSTYRELKGTGKALEAIAAVRTVKPSPGFNEQVLRAARRESEKLIESLPPERRLRAELRRATREPPEPPPAPAHPARSAWTVAAVLILAAGVLAVGAILFYRPAPAPGPQTLGTLTLTLGRVEQFYQKAGEHWSAVQPNQPVRTGDVFRTSDDTSATGRARIELAAGGAILLGPNTEVRFLALKEQGQGLSLELTKGELGAERPERGKAEDRDGEWSLRCGAAVIAVPLGAKVYLQGPFAAATGWATAVVVRGRVSVSHSRTHENLTFEAGDVAWLKPDNLDQNGALPLSLFSGVPLWRADLATDGELAALLHGQARILARQAEGLEVQLAYGFGQREGARDWRSEVPGRQFSPLAGGGLQIPAETRFELATPLAAPLAVEAEINPQTPRETAWTVTVLERAGRRVAVDLASPEATLQAGAPPLVRTARVAYREKPGAMEKVRLEVARPGIETLATLATASGKTAPLALPAGADSSGGDSSGAVWVKALGEGLFLNGLRVTGIIPREWLRDRLGGM